ncbi:MAG: hypothetical protein R3190_10325, partial [Thermoanaerobaculia bacterium]|nr:hypothetical protein [Thermoanaerobaculia bacterium]
MASFSTGCAKAATAGNHNDNANATLFPAPLLDGISPSFRDERPQSDGESCLTIEDLRVVVDDHSSD